MKRSGVFGIRLNGEILFERLSAGGGILTKVHQVRAVNGTDVEFIPNVGEPVLSVIRVKRLLPVAISLVEFLDI